jgi:hypothetical protein
VKSEDLTIPSGWGYVLRERNKPRYKT